MIVDYEGHKFIYDPEIDFLVLYKCYENGCNCYTCTERVLDGCVIDDISEEVKESWCKNENI